MPLYEYECPKCGNRFEKIEKVNAPRRQRCPKCKSMAERMFAAPAIQFKGAGWYVTDYPRQSSGGDNRQEKSAAETKEASDTKAKSEKKEPAKKDQKQK